MTKSGALNTIDLVFWNDQTAINQWREYRDALFPINSTTDEKFIELLFAMSKALKLLDYLSWRKSLRVAIDKDIQSDEIDLANIETREPALQSPD
jgi:hypothetical protein